jgi:uncharacterized membrane protein YtjA (UPF0391 family)
LSLAFLNLVPFLGNVFVLLEGTIKQFYMLKWTAIFFIIAIIAAIFGFSGIAAGAASIAKFIFFVFVVIVVVTFILGLTIFKK